MDNTDVELNELLGLSSMENTTNGASADNSTEDSPSVAASEPATNQEEPSKRAQDRIRELAEENRKLREAQAPSQSAPGDIDSFLSQIQDEGTRNLLKQFGQVMQANVEKQYSPILSSFKEEKFEKEFAQFSDKLPNLKQHKEELRKEFTRNPNTDLKGLIGSRVVDILSSRIVPLETKSAQSPRDEQSVNLNSASKEDLYAMLKARKN